MGSVHIKDGVNAVFGGQFHGVVKPFECIGFEDVGVVVVFEESVIDRKADDVESKRFDDGEVAL